MKKGQEARLVPRALDDMQTRGLISVAVCYLEGRVERIQSSRFSPPVNHEHHILGRKKTWVV